MSAEIAISPAKSVHKARLRRKRENIRGLVFPTKTPIQRAQFAAGCDQNIDLALAARPRDLPASTNFARAVSLNPATGFRKITKFFLRTLQVLSFAVKAFRQTKTNRRAKTGRPPVQSYLLYSLVSTSLVLDV